MSDWRIRRRNRLKQKESRALRDRLREVFGEVALWGDEAAVERADAPDFGVVFVDQEVRGLEQDGEPFLSVRGVLAYRPDRRYVTVDMGAVRFVTNGADIMAPGITDADPGLREGDWCWVRDENNHQPLAIGRCLVPGAGMGAARKGKAVKMVHHIGDKLWTWGQE